MGIGGIDRRDPMGSHRCHPGPVWARQPDFPRTLRGIVQKVTNNRRGRASLTDQFWRSRSAPLVLVCGGIVIALVVTALFAAVLYQGRLDAMERARETSRNLALIGTRPTTGRR